MKYWSMTVGSWIQPQLPRFQDEALFMDYTEEADAVHGFLVLSKWANAALEHSAALPVLSAMLETIRKAGQIWSAWRASSPGLMWAVMLKALLTRQFT